MSNQQSYLEKKEIENGQQKQTTTTDYEGLKKAIDKLPDEDNLESIPGSANIMDCCTPPSLLPPIAGGLTESMFKSETGRNMMGTLLEVFGNMLRAGAEGSGGSDDGVLKLQYKNGNRIFQVSCSEETDLPAIHAILGIWQNDKAQQAQLKHKALATIEKRRATRTANKNNKNSVPNTVKKNTVKQA